MEEHIFEKIIETTQALHWTEIGAVVFGLIYIVLAARENVWCWFWGILSCALWAWATYQLYDLYLDALLQVFYVVMGFVGIYQWKFGSGEKKDLKISKMTTSQHFQTLTAGLVLTFLFGYFFDEFTPAAATYLDALTTVFAIFATIMTVQKKLENWIYWIVVDALYVYLYITRGGYLFALLFVIYCIIAIVGYWNWQKEWNVQKKRDGIA